MAWLHVSSRSSPNVDGHEIVVDMRADLVVSRRGQR